MTRGSMSAKDASLPCAEAATVPLWSGAPAHPQVPLQDPAGRPEAQSSLATPLVQPKAMRAFPRGQGAKLTWYGHTRQRPPSPRAVFAKPRARW